MMLVNEVPENTGSTMRRKRSRRMIPEPMSVDECNCANPRTAQHIGSLSILIAICYSSGFTVEAFSKLESTSLHRRGIHSTGTCNRWMGMRSTPLVMPLLALKEFDNIAAAISSRQANTNMELFSPPTAQVLVSPTSSTTGTPLGGYGKSSHSNACINNPQFHPNADQRYQASDWWVIMKTLPTSSILRTTKWPVLTIMAWSVVLSSIHCAFCCIGYTGALAQTLVCPIPSTIPHAATVTALGLLLVFRTTTAYQKFDEGRHVWEHILSVSRNLTRLIYLYPEFSVERRLRIFQLVAAYPYFLHRHVSPTLAMEYDKESSPIIPESNKTAKLWKPLETLRLMWRNSGPNPMLDSRKSTSYAPSYIDRYALPWSMFPDRAVRSVANSSNRPLWACDRMAQEILAVTYTDKYTSMERSHILLYIGQLSEAVGECERIQRTAVPLNYARHSLRGLTLWLFTLPLALIHTFGWWTSPVMGLAAWLMYGIYQIGYSIEDPFQGSLRLATLCDDIFRDVMCDSRRATAFNVSMGQFEEWKDLPL